ncbi:MAG: D-alanyl-D-alanine carboxypeptidase/D-alanyl-D-alanine-endopeptidase, partial [Acidobacteriota bacterium]|nr:D-alanyl-D-alanine carboxypeptidase/D-alanyl-D-alanine-endopeptidase [Acidobacteriota bacterium]
MKLLPLFLLYTAVSYAAHAPLASRIRAVLDSSDVGRTAFWGIEVDDLDARTVLLRLNDRHFFVPASNTKLFTAALALTKLGPTFQVRTLVTAATPPDAEGRIAGDLTLVGAGDANLSGRPIPYDLEAEKRDPLTVMRELALQLYTRGVRSVAGNVVGDDTAFVWEPYGPGWGVDDPTYMDGAPVSALAVNDNSISVMIQPAALTFTPPLPVFTVENRVVAGSPRQIHITREPGSSILRLWGTLPPDDPGETDALSVDDPARFAALALKSVLQDQGITVAGDALARHLYPGEQFVSQTGIPLAQHDSPSLIEDLRITAKVSQNLHAEMLLRL